MSDEEDYYYDDGDEDMGDTGGMEDESDDEDVDEDLENVVEKEIEYSILSRDALVKKQQSEIQQVCGVLEVGAPFARMLLTHWKWNMEVLLSKFLDKGRSFVYKESGITEGEQQVLASSFTCPSCYEDYRGDETTALSCGHRFCNNCWQQYVTMKIKDGESNRVKCMGSKCNNLFDESLIASFVDESTLSKFYHFLTESYVVDSNRRKWCPSVPHCGNAVEVQFGTAVDVRCKCGAFFCFKCLNPPHPPCTCEMMVKWEQKCKDDSETSNWLNSNTKPCPKCGKVIEKDGGCNLVTCKCGQYMCWLCGAATGAAHTWTSIEGHTCGKFKDNDVDSSRRALQRYLHFFVRYKTHQDSLAKEMKLGTPQALEATMEGLRKCTTTSYGQSEISWIAKATDQLFAARRVLGNSYVFAFYVFGESFIPDDSDEKLAQTGKLDKTFLSRPKKAETPAEVKKSSAKKNLFEDHQQQLEFTTERLSSFLETPVANMTNEILQNIANYAGLAEKRCKGLQDIIQNEFLSSEPSSTSAKPSQPSATTTSTNNKQQVPAKQPDPPRKPDPPKPGRKANKANKAAVVDIKPVDNKPKVVVDVDAEDDEEATSNKRTKWTATAHDYDEEAAIQEAIKKSSTDDKDLEEALRLSLLESTGSSAGKPTTKPVIRDEDEDIRKALELSMQYK